jgi:hypothetical protein
MLALPLLPRQVFIGWNVSPAKAEGDTIVVAAKHQRVITTQPSQT